MPPIKPMVFIWGADDEVSLAGVATAPWQKAGVQNAADRIAATSDRRLIENIGLILQPFWKNSSVWPVRVHDVDLHHIQTGITTLLFNSDHKARIDFAWLESISQRVQVNACFLEGQPNNSW